MEAKRRNSFFKIMSGDAIWENMRIPPKFVSLFSKDIDSARTATLVGPSGRSRTARISHHQNNVHLKSGWQEFLKDNLVKANEMLVFTYDGNTTFLVQIFDDSGLERRNEDNTKPEYTVTKKECDAPETAVQKMNLNDDAILMLEPNRPYFSINIKPCHLRKSPLLYVHKTIAKYLSGTVAQCTLMDPDGRKWLVTIQAFDPRPQWFMRTGWRAFAEANKLKPGDTCVFELVEIPNIVLKVSITRDG